VQQYTKDHPLSEEQIKAAYEEWAKDLPTTEYHARHILVKDEATAKSILEQLAAGGDFAKLAAEFSMDPSKDTGGDLGWFTPDQMVEPFAKAVTALKAGETAQTPVQTDFGWHVVRLEETRPVAVPQLEEARDAVTNHANNKLVENHLAELRKQAKIKIDEKIITGDKPADQKDLIPVALPARDDSAPAGTPSPIRSWPGAISPRLCASGSSQDLNRIAAGPGRRLRPIP